MRLLLVALAFLAVATSASAQSTGCGTSPTASPEIAGNYVDNFGGLQAISDRFWYSGGLIFETCSVDNPRHRLVAHNNPANSFNPGKFSRFEWTKSDNRLWYCQSVYNASTEQEAASAPPADPNHPATGGCGTSAWSTLIRILP